MNNAESNLLNKKQAIEFLGLDAKAFANYFQYAEEFSSEPRANGHGWFYFDKSKLSAWLENFKWRTVTLNKEDYAQCLDFALAMHFRGYVTSDFGTGRQREFGQKLTNWIKGQLGEVAVRKFFKSEFNAEVELDFNLRDEIVPQDIISIKDAGHMRPPKIGVGIKSSKPKNAYLILGSNEIERNERKSDAYIYCRVYIPDDHLLRVTKAAVMALVQGQRHYDRYMQNIPDFADMPCEIAGWCWTNELEKVSSIPGQPFDGFRFVRQSGKLYKSKEKWQKLINSL